MSTWPSTSTRQLIGPGTVLVGRYRLGAELGAGGMGTVYRAEHLGLDRQVAVKVLHPHVATAPGAAERFQREAKILAKLDHPNAVHVYDFGADGDTLYIAMELLSGKALDTLAAEASLGMEVRRSVTICIQALEVLSLAHGLGIIHRDIKPGNIFVEQPGEGDHVKVVDFGLALLIEEPGKSRLTDMGIVHGTPEYMAPEQCLGQEIDGRVDIYSMGCVLWELLTGAPPFGIGQAVQVMTSHVYKPLPKLKDVAPELIINAALDEVISRALAKRADDRFPDATLMREALIYALDATDNPQRGIDKLHHRDASSGRTGARTNSDQARIGLWASQSKDVQGPGIAQALGAAGYDVRVIEGDVDLAQFSALVVVPPVKGNGLDVAARLAQTVGAPPVLLCGSDDNLEVMTQAIEQGVHDFVVLPLDPTELVKKVARAVRKRSRK